MLLCAGRSLRAEVGDPTLQTDHPHYAGEGAFQTVEDCVRSATDGAESPQEQAIALYQWLLTHQYHLMSPQDWCIPGRVPDTEQPRDYESVVYDANRGRFSYGYGLCGTVHAWNEPYWQALEMRARRRAFPGHVNSEVFYEGAWHAFDTDMAGLLFRRDGIVAGYEDIIRDPSLVDSVKPPLPHYPFAWPSDFQTMKRGWQEVARGGDWYALYNGGYAAHPGIVHLRAGETFTRWFDRDHYGGPSKRRFWHHKEGGPARNWTFMNRGTPHHDGEQHNARSDASYCNGEFVYRPDLASDKWREGAIAATPNVVQQDESPHVMSSDGKPASVTFRHFSPYVIAGDPEDDANPMTGPATGGLVVTGRMIGSVRMQVSADEGQTWQEVALDRRTDFQSVREGDGKRSDGLEIRPTAAHPFQIDLTNQVKGRFGWHVRFSLTGRDSGLDELEFATVTQVCQSIYPRLTPGGCKVTYRAASHAVVPVIPNFALPESEIDRFEATDLRSLNVTYHGRSEDNRFAYRTTDNGPGQIVFKVVAPQPLTEVRAAIRYQLRVPPPASADYHLDISTDDGQTWQTFATADIPADNEFSSGWLAGRVDVSAANTPHALVRVHLYAGGHKTGLIDARLYGIHKTTLPQPLTITYGWKENGVSREYAESLPATTLEHRFTVPTGESIVDEFVRLETE